MAAGAGLELSLRQCSNTKGRAFGKAACQGQSLVRAASVGEGGMVLS
jgi:hypothetical protein